MNIFQLSLPPSLPPSFFLQCKLEQQACLTGKELSAMCTGFCPCAASTITKAKRGKWPFIPQNISIPLLPSEQDFNSLAVPINPRLDFLDRYAPISEITVAQISPRVAVQLFNNLVLINYLECILYINAAKLY